jgi:ribonuclease HI
MKSKNNEIIIYTDGSSLGNPGRSGWGAVILVPDQNNSKLKVESEKCKVVELGGFERESTNNRMELMAAISALKLIRERKIQATKMKIHTDSAYVLNGITLWVYGWLKNNWRTAAKEPVLNKDLWEELFKLDFNLKKEMEIEWIKVPGHAGVKLNERCDEIATSFAAGERILLFTGSLIDYEKLF